MKEILSMSEWYIMEALWANNPLVLSEIVEAVGDNLTWDSRTYGTYVGRLCKKGFIGSKQIRGSRSFHYFPLVSREECIRNESRHIHSKMSRDNAMLFMAYMLKESGLDPENADDLKTLIDRLSDSFEPEQEDK